MNWKIKAAIQAAIAPMPFSEHINHWLQMARGAFSSEQVAHELPQFLRIIGTINEYRQVKGATILEIGTGWDARHPILFSLAGAKHLHSFDLRRHLRLKHCRDSARFLSQHSAAIAKGLVVDESEVSARLRELSEAESVAHFLQLLSMSYHAPANAAATALPDGSVDIIFSYAVLEHVPKEVIGGILVESRRILRPDGICYHMIRPGDHYAGMGKGVTQINFLKYSPGLWDLIAGNKLAYHNRLRHQQFSYLFHAHGADVLSLKGEVDPVDIHALENGFPLHRFFRALDLSPEVLAIWQTEAIFTF